MTEQDIYIDNLLAQQRFHRIMYNVQRLKVIAVFRIIIASNKDTIDCLLHDNALFQNVVASLYRHQIIC